MAYSEWEARLAAVEDAARKAHGRYFCRRCADNGIVSAADERFSMGVYAGMYCDACWARAGYVDTPFDPYAAGESLEEPW